MSSCLNMRPAAASAAASASTATAASIGEPYAFRHDVHIRFNYAEARFEGVPANFGALLASPRQPAAAAGPATPGEELNRQFGVPFRQLPRVRVAGYADRIPAVLEMLRHHFVARAGFRAPHIFRESPSKAERDQAVRDVNRGAFSPERHDVRVLGDLLKVWFRELPVPILHEIPPADLLRLARQHHADEDKDAEDEDEDQDADEDKDADADESPAQRVARRVLRRLGPLERSVLLWLADLLALVAAHQEENHMGVDQLAIVIAPNLVRLDCSAGLGGPAAAVALSKAAVDLFRAVLRARFDRRAKGEDKENER